MNILKALSVVAMASALTLAPSPSVLTRRNVSAIVSPTENANSPVKKEGESKNTKKKIKPIKDKPKQKNKSLKTVTYWVAPLSPDLQSYIKELCKKYNVSEQLAYGVMKTESDFDPNKISTTNDYGLFQINEVNRSWLEAKLGITDWFNPYQNAEAGIYMLGLLAHKYGDVQSILMAYNDGESGMKRLESDGVYSTTYSRKVISNMYSMRQREVIIHR